MYIYKNSEIEVEYSYATLYKCLPALQYFYHFLL